jgi:hypothetical protein
MKKQKETKLLSKKIPAGINHEPKPMVHAQLTTLKEHKARQEQGVSVIKAARKEPEPLSRATSDLRRVYPYIFECAAYVKTHAPDNMETDEFYTRFTMPYDVFLEYCVGNCTEQIEYLKNEIYLLIKGQPAKYIKVSETETVYAQPIIIAFKHKEPKTKKEKTITNIKQDKLVDLVQVQIIKELLDVKTGYINVPKAFYAIIRQAYETIKYKLNAKEQTIRESNDYRSQINIVKEWAQADGKTCSTNQALEVVNVMSEQGKQLEELEQGGFYKIYLAFEYILINHSRGMKQQDYSLLPMLEKCAPELIREVNGKLYIKDKIEFVSFITLLQYFMVTLQDIDTIRIEDHLNPILPILGIKDMKLHKEDKTIFLRVFFDNHKKS